MKTKVVCWLLAALVVMPGVSFSADTGLTAYPGSVLVSSDVNDADSFMVDIGTEKIHLRLYFVDSPERFVNQPHDARRVQEQSRYFGIENPQSIIYLGDQASEFAKKVLSEPFTVYTAHSRALGGAGSKRYYGFVVTSDGRDLGELLVEHGLARNFGVSRQNYAGVSHSDIELYLRDLEIAAMLKRRGIWEISNPDLIVKYRALQREEKQALSALMSSTSRLLESPLDVNSAGQRDLERIPGVGAVTAGRIISGRPYKTLEDLKNQPGIGEKLFEKIAPYLSIEGEPSSNG
jgi:endonuclease YncB( thermonuclease family)